MVVLHIARYSEGEAAGWNGWRGEFPSIDLARIYFDMLPDYITDATIEDVDGNPLLVCEQRRWYDPPTGFWQREHI